MPVTQLRVAGPGTPNARPEWSGEHSRALIERLPHSNADLLTFDGVRVAVVLHRVNNRVLVPLLGREHPTGYRRTSSKPRTIDRHVTKYVTHARRRT